jgi:hypothetical protein
MVVWMARSTKQLMIDGSKVKKWLMLDACWCQKIADA